MRHYDSLSIFPDVAQTLDGLRDRPDIQAVVFSNGTQDMVSTSVSGSADLKDYVDLLQDIVVVEEVRRYKPAPEVYQHLVKHVGKNPSQVWLVSGNPFDIVGARAFGMNAIWVDRAGNGWQDRLVSGSKGRPTAVVNSLEQVLAVVADSPGQAGN